MSFIKKTIVSIPSDLYTLELYEKIILTLICIISIVFSIIDINYFIGTKEYLLKYENDRKMNRTNTELIIMQLSGIASFMGIISVFMANKRRLSNFFWALVGNIIYGIFSIVYGYAGESQLSLFFYVPMQFLGMYKWELHMNENDLVKVKKLSIKDAILYFIAFFIISVIFFYEIRAFSIAIFGYYIFENNLAARILDSVSNGLGIIAQILMTLRYSESWYLWILVNICLVVMYAGIAGFGVEFNVLFMSCFYLINAISGLYNWSRKEQIPELPVVVDESTSDSVAII